MKIILLNTILLFSTGIIAQNRMFQWNDTIFAPNAKRIIRFGYAYDGPCTVKPCYMDCGSRTDNTKPISECRNKYIYDTIVDFLKRNPTIKIELRFYTDQRGSDKFNLKRSQYWAEGCLDELKRLKVDMNRVSAVGKGEADPIISQLEISKETDKNEQNILYIQNFRTEIVIIH